MKRVAVTELKNRLSEFLRMVKRGETLEVLEHSVPIARIEGVTGANRSDKGRLQRLVSEGLVTPARKKPNLKFLELPLLPCRADAVQILIEERGAR